MSPAAIRVAVSCRSKSSRGRADRRNLLDIMLNTVAVLLTLTAAFSYVNHWYLKWPMTIGVMAIALAVSLVVIGLDQLGYETARGQEDSLLASIDFSEVLMQGMLSFLLFAGALHVDFSQLRKVAWQGAADDFVANEAA